MVMFASILVPVFVCAVIFVFRYFNIRSGLHYAKFKFEFGWLKNKFMCEVAYEIDVDCIIRICSV